MEKMYKVKEIAEIFRFTPRTIRSFIKRGYLRAAKSGGRYRITQEEIDRIIAEGSNQKNR